MLWTILVVLFVLWLLGVVTSYTLGGFTYNLQSLVFIGYFGAPKSTSVHGWYSFQHDMSHVCPGQ